MSFTTLTTFYVETCCHDGCGIQFGMAQGFHDERLRDGGWWYCPNGHSQHYTRTTEQVLREKLERAERSRQVASEEVERQKAMRIKEERRAAAYRGQVTGLKRRAKAGVCPCCKRSFGNMRRHMATKHPEYAKESPHASH